MPERRAPIGAAVVVATMPGALVRVGGLALAERAVLAAREAGLAPIGVVAGAGVDRLRSALAGRGVAVIWLDREADLDRLGPAMRDAVTLLPGDVLVDAAGARGALACPRTRLRALVGESARGEGSIAARALVDAARRRTPPAGLFVPLDAAHPPAVLEQRLLDEQGRVTAALDSYLAALVDRRLSRPVTRALLRTPVTPKQVTLVGVGVGLLGAAGLASTLHGCRVAGVLALIASVVLDCVDGELARARRAQSPAGARLDLAGDYAVHAATFLGLVAGVLRRERAAPAWWAALALLLGVGVAMAAVHARSAGQAVRRGGDLHWPGAPGSLRSSPAGRVLERLASRDYVYLLLVLALVDRLEWFLYGAAVGAWAFVGGLVVAGRRARAPGAAGGGLAGSREQDGRAG